MSGTPAFPLQWPAGIARSQTSRIADAPFSVTLGDAIKQVMHEIRLMGGTLPVLSSNLELRRDGLPYASQRQPGDCGVAVYFQRQKRPMVFACDRWRKVEHNIRAIAKTIEALRGIERWGSAEMMDRAFTGFEALPAPEQWWDVLGVPRTSDRAVINEAYRIKARGAHPDTGGSDTAMARLNAARDQALTA